MRASRGRVDGDPVLVVEERAGGVVLDEHGIPEGEAVVVRALDRDAAPAVAHVDPEGRGIDGAIGPDRDGRVRGPLENSADGDGQMWQVARRPRPPAVARGCEPRVGGRAVGIESALLEDRDDRRRVVRVDRDPWLHLRVRLRAARTSEGIGADLLDEGLPPECVGGLRVRAPGDGDGEDGRRGPEGGHGRRPYARAHSGASCPKV